MAFNPEAHRRLVAKIHKQQDMIKSLPKEFNSEEMTEKKFLKRNLFYERHHPFYPEWDEWQDIVLTYHSAETKKMQSCLNKGFRHYSTKDVNNNQMWLIDEVYFKSTEIVAELEQHAIQPNGKFKFSKDFFRENFYLPTRPVFNIGFCECDDEEDILRFPDFSCSKSLWHKRQHILSYIWAWYWATSPRKSIKKYYTRLEKLVLSLPEKYLNQFTPDLITDPTLSLVGRNLIIELYRRAILDPVTIGSFVQQCEYLKHFIAKEQGASACQSLSGDTYDSMLLLAEKLFSRDDSVMNYLCVPREQGFGIPHEVKHSWDEQDLVKLRQLVTEAKEDFMESFKKTAIDTTKTLIVMFLVASIIALLSKIVIGASATLVYKLIHLICSFVCGSGDSDDIKLSFATQQSGEQIETIPILPRLITKYVIGPPENLISSIWHSKNTDLVMRRIGYLGDIKIEKGLDRIMVWIRSVLNRTVKWFYQTFLGIECPEDLSGEDHAVSVWCKDVDDIIKQYYSNTLVWTDATWSVVYNLYARGLSLVRSKAYKSDHQNISRTVTQLGNLLEQFKKHNRNGQTIRNPPVTIYLYGNTGVGKSAMTYPLAINILKKIFAQENNKTDLKAHWRNLIYMRSAEQEYWDGYQNQLVTLFDDFNQQSDSASNPSIELFEIIRASNCFPYPLHMAGIEEKATTTFTSKIIIVSSNNKKPKTESLNYPQALQRRFDLCVEVKRKPNVQLKKDAPFDHEIYDYSFYDMVTGVSLEHGVKFDELVDRSVIEYFSRRNFVDSVEKYIDTIFDNEPEIKFGDGSVIVDKDDKVVIKEQAGEFEIEQGPLLPSPVIDYDAWSDSYIDPPFYKRWQRKLCRWWNGTSMDRLSACVDRLKGRAQARTKEFMFWKQKYNFLPKFRTTMMFLIGGMAFIALFAGISKLIKSHQKGKILTAGQFEAKIKAPSEWKLRQESYSAVAPKPVKVEGYSPQIVQAAKIESYNQTQVQPAKIESAEQGVRDLNAAEVLISIARKNLYKMYESTQGVAIGHVFFLRGKIAVMPRHYLTALKQSLRNDPNATVYFEAVVLERSFEVRVEDMLKHVKTYESPEEGNIPVASRDLMAVVITPSIIHADATSFFCMKNSLSRVDKTEVMLPVLVKNNLSNSKRAVMVVRFTSGRSQLRTRSELPVQGNDGDRVLRIVRDAWEYEMDTQSTECGSPLIVRNTQINPGKICGFHIAGVEGTGLGFSTPFYYEDAVAILDSFDSKYTIKQIQELPLKDYPVEQCQVPESAEFIRHGALEKPIAQPVKTKILPSLVYKKIVNPKTKPTALRPVMVDGKEFNPRSFRLNKLGNICVPQKQYLIENASAALLDDLSEQISQHQDMFSNNVKAVYSFEEAVLGIDGEPFINSIKRDTSAGFPYVQKGITRKEIFGNGDVYRLDTPRALELRARCERIIEAAKRNEALDHYFCDTLKDERKPIPKAHKTRLFSACPLDYLIVCKQYFNGVVVLLSTLRNKTHVSVGSNPYSEDWGQIAKLLLRKSKHMVAGDFEGFDASQHALLLEAASEVLIGLSVRFLGATDEDVRVMRVLMVSLINSFHICGKEVYQWTHSLPSGHYLTAIINSIFVNISFSVIWQLAFNEYNYYFARSFWQKCGIVAYGDDHIVSVPDEYLDKFNQFTIPTLFKQIGLSYTMEDKDAEVQAPSRSLDNISYLKRSFYYDEESARWLAPLSLDVVLETPMWMHQNPDHRAQTISGIEWALKELALHPPAFWECWSPVVRRAAESLGHYTQLKEQSSARAMCLSQSFEL